MSSGKRITEGHRARPLTGNRSTPLDERLAAVGQGCQNRPTCRHGDGLHEDGMCTAFNCYCGHSFRAPPTASSCWMQAYTETLSLPSWERERRLRPRYEELLRVHGLLMRLPV